MPVHPRAILVCGIAGILCLVLGLPGCSRPAPEQALRQAIGDMRAAVQSRDAAGLDEHVAADFIGPEGMSKADARRLAQVVFLRHRDIGVTLGPLDVSLQGDHATARFTAVVTGGSGVLPASGQVYQVQTAWRLEAGEWRLLSAEWDPPL